MYNFNSSGPNWKFVYLILCIVLTILLACAAPTGNPFLM